MHVEKNIRHSSVYRGCVKTGSMEANTKISMMAEEARKNKRQGREMWTKRGCSHPQRHKSLHWTSLICFFLSLILVHPLLFAVTQQTFIPSVKFTDKKEHKLGIEQPGCGTEGTSGFCCCCCHLSSFHQSTTIIVSDTSTTFYSVTLQFMEIFAEMLLNNNKKTF